MRGGRILIAGIVVALVMATVGFSLHTATGKNPIQLSIVVTNHGPLHSCPAPFTSCAADTITRFYLFVSNTNPPSQIVQPREPVPRNAIPNAYVVSSVDEKVTVSGSTDCPVVCGTFTLRPPPNQVELFSRFFAGHWPAIVTCDNLFSSDPCTTVSNPAALPGENIVMFYIGWAHGAGEPDGNYVFTFTFHGTVNGAPLDLNASSSTIVMTV